MKRMNTIVRLLALLLISPSAVAGGPPLGTTFTYQGRLSQSGAPATGPLDLVFRLFDAPAAGVQIGSDIAIPGFSSFDAGGTFTVSLDFGTLAFNGSGRWLEVLVNAVPLSPRQPVTPAPYALHAQSVASVANAALSGTYSNALALSNAANQFTGNFSGTHSGSGAGLVGLNASNLASGTLVSARLSGAYTNALNLSNVGNSFVGNFSGSHSGSGAGLTGLNATNLASGTLNIARAPTGGNWTLSSALNLDTNTFVVDAANDRVGIGTDTPTSSLTVTSTGARAVEALNTASGGTAYGVFAQSASFTGAGVRGDATSAGANYGLWGSTSSPLGTGAFGNATAGSGNTIGVWGQVASPTGYAGYFLGPAGSRNYFQRDVGIGTTAPLTELHVANVSGNVDMLLKRNDATHGFNFGVSTTPMLFISRSDGTTFNDYVAIDGNNGNVGIGTTGPDARLHVDGDALVTTNLRVGTGANELTIGENGIQATTDFDLSTQFGNDLSIVSGGDLNIAATTPFTFVNVDGRSVFVTSIITTLLLGGNVGIGPETFSPTMQLHVDGLAGKPGGGLWAVASDARLKHNVHPLDGALDRLLALRGVTFEYLDPAAIRELPGVQTGFIAQEVQAVFPEWVDEAADGFLRLSERGTTALFVEALRELRAENDAALAAVQAETDRLREENRRLSSEVDELRRLVQEFLAHKQR